MTEQEGLFDMVPTPRETGRAVSELRRLHIVGEALLGPITEDLGLVRCIYRARVWSPDPRRAHEITVRYSTPGHRKSAEWEALTMGEVEALAYGWLDEEETLRRYAVVNADSLVDAMLHRPACLVPSTRTVLAHHAPGGAEFLVVDLRKVPQSVLADAKGGTEIASWTKHPAPRVTQGDLW